MAYINGNDSPFGVIAENASEIADYSGTEQKLADDAVVARTIKQGAVDMKLAVLKGDMKEFARILGQGWEDKKKMAVYNTAIFLI